MDIGVGLVGFGAAGRRHQNALEGESFAHVRAVIDADPTVDTGGLRRVAGWDGLLADPGVRLVSLCLPPGGRAVLVAQALEAGKAVLVEKPPAVSVAELDHLLDLADKHRQPIGVVLQHRQAIPEDVRGWDWSGASGVLQVSRYQSPARLARADWRRDPVVASGGVVAHLGVDYLDLACQLLGEPGAVRLAGRREHAAGIDSRVVGTVEFAGGAVLALMVTGESTAQVEFLEVLGADRRLRVHNGAVTVDDRGRIEDRPALGGRRLLAEVYRDLAEAVATGGEPGRFGLRRARAVTGILEQVAAVPGRAVRSR